MIKDKYNKDENDFEDFEDFEDFYGIKVNDDEPEELDFNQDEKPLNDDGVSEEEIEETDL